MRKYSFALLLFIFLLPLQAQKDFRVMFYNVENLFDTKDNPVKNDDDFLPQGKQRWSNQRYWKKLNDISKAITSVGNGYPPALVGLCEVESDLALSDLTKKAALNRHKYNYIITNSKDDRGINVALLYQRDEIKILKKAEYTPSYKGEPKRKSRSILHVTGKIANGDTLDIFVCHFHSRVEGIKKTNTYRVQAAQLLKQKTDYIFKLRKKANIIIMGDFNDFPNNASLHETLGAQSIETSISNKKLYNLFLHRMKEKDFGSYKHKGKWGCLDQFIVSGNLLNNTNRVRVKDKKAEIFSSDFLLQEDKKSGSKKTFRTYLGFKYLGGTSDHLPIYMDLITKK